MQSFKVTIAAILFAFMGNGAAASVMYSIDSAQSYITAYVPSWDIKSVTPLLGSFGTVLLVEWQLEWTIQTLNVSGTLKGMSESSPWRTGWDHLAISDMNLVDAFPDSMLGPTLPTQITYSVSNGQVWESHEGGSCNQYDPFFNYPGFGFVCWSAGGTLLSGYFDGSVLDLVGNAEQLFFLVPTVYQIIVGDPNQQTLNPGSPPPVDQTLYPAQWVGYRVVANVVPEPGTIFLILVGGLGIVAGSSRSKDRNCVMHCRELL